MALSLPSPRWPRAPERRLLSILTNGISPPLADHKQASSQKNAERFVLFTLTPPKSRCRARAVRDVPGEQQGRGSRTRWSAPRYTGNVSIGARKDRALRRGLAAVDADAGATGLFQRDAAHGGARLFLDFGFALRVPAPRGKGETGLDRLFQVVVGFRVMRVGFAECQSLVMQRLLNFGEQAFDGGGQAGQRRADLPFSARTVAAREDGGLLSDVLGSELDAQGNAAHFPVVELPAGAGAFALVERNANVGLRELRFQFSRGVEDQGFFFVGLVNGNDNDLIGREFRRQDQPLIVAVHHDDGADDARGESPGRCPAMLELAVLVEVAHLEGLCEILTEEMRGAGLQSFAVAHHGFDGIRDVSAGEFFSVGFLAGDYGNSGIIDSEIGVDVEHLARS